MKIIREEQKPVYCSIVTYLEIPDYHLSDKKFKSIVGLFPNIVHLNLHHSVRFSNKTLNRIAESYPNLKYLNLGGYNGDRLITDKGLYAITNSCHKLEYLNISSRKEFSEIMIWNVIHSCPRIQEFVIYGCKISNTTFKEIELYLKIKYINPDIATRYLEKIGQSQMCFSSSSSGDSNLSENSKYYIGHQNPL
ncbi:18920_t:CDS:1 [Funneliformis geosporum]|uniref:18920_t:CDS:1 n=1 Tax=Funneliformis geosporum TaxID=1117311 RepID=A0A9W4WUD4_9GLOM|nr:18920_t:CDS:1 [Funneliformis geosporum]